MVVPRQTGADFRRDNMQKCDSGSRRPKAVCMGGGGTNHGGRSGDAAKVALDPAKNRIGHEGDAATTRPVKVTVWIAGSEPMPT